MDWFYMYIRPRYLFSSWYRCYSWYHYWISPVDSLYVCYMLVATFGSATFAVPLLFCLPLPIPTALTGGITSPPPHTPLPAFSWMILPCCSLFWSYHRRYLTRRSTAHHHVLMPVVLIPAHACHHAISFGSQHFAWFVFLRRLQLDSCASSWIIT